MVEPEQLTLLPDADWSPASLEAQLGSIDWSYSRRTVLNRCPRQYYFEYFGASKRQAEDDPSKRLLMDLKSLSNRDLRVGDLVHGSIARYFRAAQKGFLMSVGDLVPQAVARFRADRDYSRLLAAGQSDPPANQPEVVALREYVYADPEVERLMDEAEARLRFALNAFGALPALEPFRFAGRGLDALVEWNISVRGLPCRVHGKVDLAFGTSSRAFVVDWKLGRVELAGEDSLQLAVYALWACQQFSCSPEHVKLIKAFLGSGEIREYQANHELMATARLRIVQDAERMAAVHDYGERGIVAAFTPASRRRVCAQCAYLRACPEGTEALTNG